VGDWIEIDKDQLGRFQVYRRVDGTPLEEEVKKRIPVSRRRMRFDEMKFSVSVESEG
jgi:hypothetical protein